MIRFECEPEMIGGREVTAEITGDQFARISEIVAQAPDDDYRVIEHWFAPEGEGSKEWSIKLWREHGNGAPPTFHHIDCGGAVLDTGWSHSIPQRGE